MASASTLGGMVVQFHVSFVNQYDTISSRLRAFPPPVISYGSQPTSNDNVQVQLMERDSILATLKYHLELARNQMKKQVGRKRRDVEYEVDDWVFLKLRPYRKKFVAHRRNEKLAPRFFGPYRISARIGPVAYRLELPTTSTIHNVFHVSQLKKVLGADHQSQVIPNLPILTEEFEWLLQPEAVLGVRWNPTHKENEWLVQWQYHQPHEATWESAELMQRQFPSFHLEDKVVFQPGGIVRPPIVRTYKRKGGRGSQGISTETVG